MKQSLFRLLALFFLLVPASCSQDRQEAGPPNIVLAIADDWSWPHAGAYGATGLETPHFDRVAREGILFQNAFVASPSCTPSRAAVLTGQWHWRLEESANLWSTLRGEFPVYPDLLEEAGYFVGYSGKGWGPGRVEPGGRQRNPAGPRFEGFQEFLEQRPEGVPFCFWLGSQDPHRPYEPGSGAADGIPLQEIEVPSHFPDSGEVRSDLADYYGEVQRFDRQVGEVLKRLEEMGELENTLVVVTSDNGMPFPRCKGNLYDCGTRVPLALRWGARGSEDARVDAFVSLTDLAPTFLEAAGLPVPETMTGSSLQALMGAASDGVERKSVLLGKERHVPCQEAPESGGTPMRALRTGDFLYIRNFLPERWPAGTPNYEVAYFPGSWYGDIDNGPTKFAMFENRDRDEEHRRQFELAFGKRPAEELFDLSADPEQLENVAGQPAYRETRKRLAAELEEALRASGDPRIVGGAEKFDRFPYYGGSPLWPGYEQQE